MPAKAKVEISYDGTEMYVSSNDRLGYGFFNGNQITRVGNVALSYGLFGGKKIQRIGGFTVVYGWFGHVERVVGQDDRVEVFVRSRAESRPTEDREVRQRRR